MKNFKSFVIEAEEYTPEYIDNVLKQLYKLKSKYTLVENNRVVTKADIVIRNLDLPILPVHIKQCKNFTIKNCAITSTRGFPASTNLLVLEECNKIKKIIFDKLLFNELIIVSCEAIHTIDINCTSLVDTQFVDNNKLKKISISNTGNLESVDIDKCENLELKNVVINNNNYVDQFRFLGSRKLFDFVGFSISSFNAQFDCNSLKSFDGLEHVKTENLTFYHLPTNVKNLSNLLLVDADIRHISFDDEDYSAHWTARTFTDNKLTTIINKYVYKHDKKDHIMDFTMELIDAGFDDQV